MEWETSSLSAIIRREVRPFVGGEAKEGDLVAHQDAVESQRALRGEGVSLEVLLGSLDPLLAHL